VNSLRFKLFSGGDMNVKKLFRQHLFVFLIGLALIAAGCGGGSSSYDEPDSTHTANVLIDAPTLKSWVDSGLVNNETGYEKVVILDVDSQSNYRSGHIPGAQCWEGDSGDYRYDGPVYSYNMVLSGKRMDEKLQSYGIDENTTVVFAGGTNPGRIYFMFRYWGFPKDKIKVLDGGKGAWVDAGYELSRVQPAISPSNFSVKQLNFNPDERAALVEMMDAVETGWAVPLNTLPGNTNALNGTTGALEQPYDYCSTDKTYYDGTGYVEYDEKTCTGDRIDSKTINADKVIFQGTPFGAKHLSFAQFYVGGNRHGYMKSAEEIKTLLMDVGIDGSKPIITYCRAGNAAAWGYLPIVAALDWDVMVYDGSWSQWGSLTNKTNVPHPDFTLPAELSEWATDVLTTGNDDGVTVELPMYNADAVEPNFIEQPVFRILDGVLTPDDSNANSIENEDREYWEAPSAGAVDSTSGGGSSGGGGC
jgi:3-mercaptopyruvate sulfurtransferase SseA